MTETQPAGHLPDELPADPMHRAGAWLEEAGEASAQRNPNSMTLATVGADGHPTARVMLCKAFHADPGFLVFYTNYHSRKALDIDANPRVALVFHWDTLGRQIRMEGIAVHSPTAESDAYFATRDRGSQLGAWGSDQSRVIASRAALVAQIRERAAGLGLELEAGTTTPAAGEAPRIERPPHWGGIRVWADAVELWVEAPNRMHDRARWTRRLTPRSEHEFAATPWSGTRLQP